MVEEVHFVKMVQGGIWGDGVAVVVEGLMRFEAGSRVVGIIDGGADGVADSLWVRFGILRGG
jgi:hypothetical protein